MVLVYLTEPGAPAGARGALVLDNMVKRVLPAEQRKDLIAVFTVDAHNKVTVYKDVAGKRTVRAEVENAKLAKLDKIKRAIDANREKYRALNNGRAFF